jgi:hypothetical protein
MDATPVIVVLMKATTAVPRRAALLRWLRALVPAALLVVSTTPVEVPGAEDVITLNADAIESGPLAVADAIVKARDGR